MIPCILLDSRKMNQTGNSVFGSNDLKRRGVHTHTHTAQHKEWKHIKYRSNEELQS